LRILKKGDLRSEDEERNIAIKPTTLICKTQLTRIIQEIAVSKKKKNPFWI
jgi:hypothetical protein